MNLKNVKPLILVFSLCIITLIGIILAGIIFFFKFQSETIDKISNLKIFINEQQAQKDELQAQIEKYKNIIARHNPYSLISVSPANRLNWSTYTNSNFGFEIDFPNDYIIDLSDEINGSILLRSKTRQLNLDQDKMVRKFDVMIKVYNTPNDFYNSNNKISLKEWIDSEADQWGFIQRKPILIDGLNGYNGISNSMIYGNYLQFVEFDGKLYQAENEGSSVQGDIIKSFRFIK